jgi:hypothetical protein
MSWLEGMGAVDRVLFEEGGCRLRIAVAPSLA